MLQAWSAPAAPQPIVAGRTLPGLERLALTLGIMDGHLKRGRLRIQGLFVSFDNPKSNSLANPYLEALRAFAEPSLASLRDPVPAGSLEELGFSAVQIEAARQFAAADAAPCKAGKRSSLEE